MMDNLNNLPLDHPDSLPLLPDEIPDWKLRAAQIRNKPPIPKYKEMEIEARLSVNKKRNQILVEKQLYNTEAEQSVLGGILLSPDCLNTIKGQLRYTDFYQTAHQFIYTTLCELAEKQTPIDAVTVNDWFLSNNLTDRLPHETYVIELAMNTCSVANIQAYVNIVRDKAARRELIKTARAIIDSANDPDGRESIELLTDANTQIANLCKENMRGGELKLMESGLGEMFTELEKRQKGTISGIVPQWKSIKDIIPKLEGGKLMVVAARPGVGKSANALQWALHAAQEHHASAVFSLEMGMNELIMRTLSNLTTIPLYDLQRENGINNEDWSRITNATRIMQNLPLAIDDSDSITVEQVRARAIHFHSQCKDGLKLIVVDYLQLMSTHGKKHANRNEEIAHISRELKKLAKEINCPIIALSQLNRAVEFRADKAPNRADLLDSGAI